MAGTYFRPKIFEKFIWVITCGCRVNGTGRLNGKFFERDAFYLLPSYKWCPGILAIRGNLNLLRVKAEGLLRVV